MTLCSVGGVFGGPQMDAGSSLLWRTVDHHWLRQPDGLPGTVLDLGCGNGTLTAALARALPERSVLGTDDDRDAVRSTRATLAANQVSAEVRWEMSAAGIADSSIDAVLLNPPFHDGAALDATLVQDLLNAAARVLRLGGALWFVHNSHLRYRPELERRIGPVEELARDRRFTVLRATRQ